MSSMKKVLVRFGDRCKPVQFTGGDLHKEIRKAFVLNEEDFFLQIKDEEWGGEFVDLSDEQEIPDKSVLKMVLMNEVL